MKRARFQISTIFLFLLAGCSPVFQNTPGVPSPFTLTLPATIKPMQVTVTASPSPTATTLTPTPFTATPVPTEPGLENRATVTPVCNQAAAGNPFDVTIPDDTWLNAGQPFSKTWRLVNTGSCAWTSDYHVVFFSGAMMGAALEAPLTQEAAPGETVDISIDLTAPPLAGEYQSNWKIRSPEGELFGIGPSGDAAFWVRVQVQVVNTPTPTPTYAPPTPAPILAAAGRSVLRLDDTLNLKSGIINPPEDAHIGIVKGDGDSVEMIPINGGGLVVFGNEPPGMAECMALQTEDKAVPLSSEMQGLYLCARTPDGAPGRILLAVLDLDALQFDLDFVTWTLP